MKEMGCSDRTYIRAYGNLIKSGEIIKKNIRQQDGKNQWYSFLYCSRTGFYEYAKVKRFLDPVSFFEMVKERPYLERLIKAGLYMRPGGMLIPGVVRKPRSMPTVSS